VSEFRLTTPVALLIFNRRETAERVFAEIARAKPPKLLVVGDGPRANRQGEAEQVAATRAIIKRVNWDCDVMMNFSEVNMGCRERLSSGLDWVFQNVEEAIILEDDCLPDPTFFRFCQEMLAHYRHDQRIGMVACTNTQFGHGCSDYSYYFSKYPLIWGWASWRDRWKGSYDVRMAKWPRIRDAGLLGDMIGNPLEADNYWQFVLERAYRGEIDTWDYQWFFANWLEGRMSVVPTVNLISNIGYKENATHTVNSKSHLANIPRNQICFPLKHPLGVFKNIQADQFTDLVYFLSISPIHARKMILNRMRKEKRDKLCYKLRAVFIRLLRRRSIAP